MCGVYKCRYYNPNKFLLHVTIDQYLPGPDMNALSRSISALCIIVHWSNVCLACLVWTGICGAVCNRNIGTIIVHWDQCRACLVQIWRHEKLNVSTKILQWANFTFWSGSTHVEYSKNYQYRNPTVDQCHACLVWAGTCWMVKISVLQSYSG